MTMPSNRQTKAEASPVDIKVIALSELHEAATERTPARSLIAEINPLHQVKARLQVCIGEAEITVGELLNAKEHQVLRLDKQVEQPIDLLLDGKLVARGQLVAVDDYFAVRITDLPVALKM